MSWMERVLGTNNSNAVASFNAFTDSHVHVLHKMLRDSRTAAARLARRLGQSSYACTRREHLASGADPSHHQALGDGDPTQPSRRSLHKIANNPGMPADSSKHTSPASSSKENAG